MSNCYKCNPNGYFKESIFHDTRTVLFCFDLHKRPIICIVPKIHYRNMNEISGDMLKEIFNDINEFIELNHIDHYQISFNQHNLKHFYNQFGNNDYNEVSNNNLINLSNVNNHFFMKLKFSPEIVLELRKNHFEKISAEKNMRN